MDTGVARRPIVDMEAYRQQLRTRREPLADGDDRALAVGIEDGQTPAGRCLAGRIAHGDPELCEPRPRAPGELVVADRCEEGCSAGQARELNGRHRAAARRLLEAVMGVHDLAGRGHVVAAHELDPLDVSDNR